MPTIPRGRMRERKELVCPRQDQHQRVEGAHQHTKRRDGDAAPPCRGFEGEHQVEPDEEQHRGGHGAGLTQREICDVEGEEIARDDTKPCCSAGRTCIGNGESV